MVGVDVAIHGNSINGENGSVSWEGGLSFKAIKEVPAVFEVGWTEV
jgi:hypothetical protein